jgi:hypothetical protein
LFPVSLYGIVASQVQEKAMVEKRRSPGDWVQLKINMRERLRAKLERAAADNGHPMNVEIMDRLERSFAKDDMAKLMKQTAERAAEVASTTVTEQFKTIYQIQPMKAAADAIKRDVTQFEEEKLAREAARETLSPEEVLSELRQTEAVLDEFIRDGTITYENAKAAFERLSPEATEGDTTEKLIARVARRARRVKSEE